VQQYTSASMVVGCAIGKRLKLMYIERVLSLIAHVVHRNWLSANVVTKEYKGKPTKWTKSWNQTTAA